MTRSFHRGPRRVITVLVLGGTALLAAACGSSAAPAAAPTVTRTVTAPAPAGSASGSAPSTPVPTATASTPGSPPPCPTSSLHVASGQGNGAAGSQYVPIVFTNNSGTACSLFGFPGVSFVTEGSGGGSQIGRAAGRDTAAGSQLITLVPGAAAHATLQVVDAANFPPGKCQLVMAHWLKIYPPNQTAPLYLHFTAQACASHAKTVGILNVQPVQLGSGGA